MQNEHNRRLQSLRGVAALMVLLGHSKLLLDYRTDLKLTQMVLQPNSAVLFFYVLSGYVLGGSIRRTIQMDAPLASFTAFVVKRLTRLLPVYWIAIFVGALTYIIVEHQPINGVDPWFGGNFGGAAGVTPSEIAINLIGRRPSMNGALWSVQIELFIIPVLPLLVLLARRVPLWADIVIIAILCAISIRLMFGPVSGTPLNFVAYLYFFYLGIVLPKFMQRFRSLFASGTLFGCGITSFLFFGATHVVFGISFPGKLVIDGAISAVIIAFVLNSETSATGRLLSLRPLIWLGDISYSFYAYATCILMMVAFGIIVNVPQEWLLAAPGAPFITSSAAVLTLVVALPLAFFSYTYVELPFMSLGRRLATNLDRRARAASSLTLSTPAQAGALTAGSTE